MAEVSAVVVTYDALPWIERCLASVAGCETVVVDNGSSDGTVELVRERFPGQPALPVAEKAGAEVLSLPLSPAHSDEDIGDAVAALRRVHATFRT